MKRPAPALLAAIVIAMPVAAQDTKPPATSKVDAGKEAEHRKEDIRKHRIMSAAHEAAAKCLESGKEEKTCTADLVQACKGVALGKHCGMRH
jgi:hypothetical protein